MRTVTIIALAACLLISLIASADARETKDKRFMARQTPIEAQYANFDSPEAPFITSEVDTYTIVYYNFEYMDWQGWTRVDNTAQVDTFFHVDDFAGLGGGDFGRLLPLEGTKSMWCGARANPGSPYLCSWQEAPGYGNSWNQILATNALQLVGNVTISYKILYDSEEDYDFTYVEYDAGDGNWELVAEYTGIGSGVVTASVPMTHMSTKLRFHFTSDGEWSDEDGKWNTDGACILDSIRVADTGGYVNFENFEGAPVGARHVGIWHARVPAQYGLYSGLRSNLADRDPCMDNFSTQVVFFIGSPFPSSEYPGLYNTPFCKGPTTHDPPCQDEMIVSPIIDLTKYSTRKDNVQDAAIPPEELAHLGSTRLLFGVYVDCEDCACVYNLWYVRPISSSGCPGPWKGMNYWYGNYETEYYTGGGEITGLIGTADSLQVGLAVADLADVYYLTMGNCATHTPAPWFDNVRVQRINTRGPQWSYCNVNLFQDNFPIDENDIESFVRADAAADRRALWDPGIDPGDSIYVWCSSKGGGGLAHDPGGGSAVYMHVRCSYIGPPPIKPPLAGPSLEGTYGTYKSDDGTWTVIQGDSVNCCGSYYDDAYKFDLNDSLFTRGYLIEYYFTAIDSVGEETTLPKWSLSHGPYFEFTCLPTLASDILLVDDYDGIGSMAGSVENYWDPVFRATVPLDNQPDRYDVNRRCAYDASNGLASRAHRQQLTGYNIIIWDSGNEYYPTIGDGTEGGGTKSNDCQLLIDWMNLSEHRCGLWICGNEVADDLSRLSATALAFMNTWCGVTLVNDSYYKLTGSGVMNPLITGAPAGIFLHGGAPDQFSLYGFGWCYNDFDCLGKTANGAYALEYPDYDGTKYYAGIQSETTNAALQPVRTMWFGFSFQYVRDDQYNPVIDRFELAHDVFEWMGNPAPITDAGAVPAVYALGQNFPNPFNPVTEIKYDMKEKGLVAIKVYDVAGHLVRTLVDGVEGAGSHRITWDGKNNLGTETASGIYFYKMETNGFGATKKMVLLR